MCVATKVLRRGSLSCLLFARLSSLILCNHHLTLTCSSFPGSSCSSPSWLLLECCKTDGLLFSPLAVYDEIQLWNIFISHNTDYTTLCSQCKRRDLFAQLDRRVSLWDLSSRCNVILLNGYQYVRGTYCLHLQPCRPPWAWQEIVYSDSNQPL